MDEYSDEVLMHYGKKGMKWGVRHEAEKDAKEYARAKMFYGEGAGNRRKLINKSVEAKKKRDPMYTQAFEEALAKQDMAKHASKARSERKRKDTGHAVAKTTRGIKNAAIGNTAFASTAGIAIVAGAKYAHDKGLDKKVAKYGKTTLNTAKVFVKSKGIKRAASAWL